uniref:hypothetical protein n=1 Tax=Agathobacter sp. TaxID=2021311 RepID=UPI0040567C2E
MILFKKKYKNIFLLVPLVLLYRYDLLFFPQKTNEHVGEVFLMHLFGGSYDMEKADLTVSVVGLVGIIFLSLLFADYIICDLRESAEYIFTRYMGRKKWYLRKLGELFAYCNVGIFLYILFYVLNAVFESEKQIAKEDILVIVCTYIMLLLFTYCITLSINLLSLFFDTTIGFIICYTIIIISSMGMIGIQGMESEQIAEILHKANPMSNLLVSWNFSNTHILWGITYYTLLTAIVSLLLWRKIKNYEIGLSLKNKHGERKDKWVIV